MEEQTHEKSAHAAGIYDATVQNQRCRALLDYIIGTEIALDAPRKLKLGARTKVPRSSGPGVDAIAATRNPFVETY